MRAIHVNHGLQAEAGQWAQHCQNVCDAYQIPLEIQSVRAQGKSGESPEEAARNARYHAFNALLTDGDLLLMAHHQDDQAETVLLQLLRGAGLEGISGMPLATPLGKGILLRPLLDIDSRQILAYAEQKQLRWIEDPSNQDSRFDRNYLRKTILPLIQVRWPAVSRVLSRTARHAADAADHQRNQQRNLAAKIAPRGHFILSHTQGLDALELRLAIRGWFDGMGLRMPSERMTHSIVEELLGAGVDRNPMIRLPDGSQLVRYRDVAYRIPALAEPSPCTWPDWRQPISLPGDNGTLSMSIGDCAGAHQNLWDSHTISIRYRTGGEMIRLEGRQGHHALRDLYQERGIPPWVRKRIPLIYLRNQLAWVGGIWRNHEILGAADNVTTPRPIWSPPEGIDPSGALETLKNLPR